LPANLREGELVCVCLTLIATNPNQRLQFVSVRASASKFRRRHDCDPLNLPKIRQVFIPCTNHTALCRQRCSKNLIIIRITAKGTAKGLGSTIIRQQ